MFFSWVALGMILASWGTLMITLLNVLYVDAVVVSLSNHNARSLVELARSLGPMLCRNANVPPFYLDFACRLHLCIARPWRTTMVGLVLPM